jgi:hypothetical protein
MEELTEAQKQQALKNFIIERNITTNTRKRIGINVLCRLKSILTA